MKPKLFAWKNSSFDPLKRFHNFLNNLFYTLGHTIASNPSYFIIFPIFLTVLGLTGFQRLKHEDNPELLFYPATGPAPKERQIIETFFPINFSSSFLPHHLTQSSGFARVLIKGKDDGNIFKRAVWKDMKKLDRIIKNIKVKYKDKDYHYKNICAKWDGKCFENRVMNLEPLIPEIENGTLFVNYPIMLFPLILPYDFGGLEVDEQEGIIKSAKAVSLAYFLKQNTEEEQELSLLWEQEFLNQMQNIKFQSMTFAYFAARSRKDEMLNNTNSIRPYAAYSGIIMVLFSVASVMAADWVRGKMILGVLGVVSAGMGTLSAFGYLMYLSIPFISINKIIPFLMLGIGIDDMFVVLASWRRSNIQDTVVKRLSETYADAGVSITITSLTNMLSFSVGIITPILGVQIFCIYTTLSVLLTYLWHLTFFGGCLAVAGYLEKDQRHSLICIRVQAKSISEKGGRKWYSVWCAGGINKDDPWNERDNRPHAIMVAFGDYLGKGLSIPWVKVTVLWLFFLYLAGAIYGCTTLQEGLDRKNVVAYGSYAVDYYNWEETLFRKFPYVIQVVITGDVNYSDPRTRDSILRLHDNLERTPFTAENIFTQSWMRGFYRFIDSSPKIRNNITDEKSFITILRSEYAAEPANPIALDIVYDADYSRIIASRMTIHTYEITDTHKQTAMVNTYRQIAQNSEFNVTVFNPNFILFDQYTLVRPITIQAISIAVVAMVIISLLLIPNPWCSLLVGVAIVSIETGVIGYMALWGVNLDQISMINLIMCIGFSVDFSAHISYAYLTAKVDSAEERLRNCLYSLGLPIVQGGLSTVICIISFILAPSYVYVTFFKIVFLVVFFAMVHGLLLIPVLLSLFESASGKDHLWNTEIKIPRVKLTAKVPNYESDGSGIPKAPNYESDGSGIPKAPNYDAEGGGVSKVKKNTPCMKHKSKHNNENWAEGKTSSGSRPDPEGCSNGSFENESEKSELTKER